MAFLLSKVGVVDGSIVFASHVIQLIDAFTYVKNYDLLISGGFYIGTTVSGSDKTRILGNLNVIGPVTASNISSSFIVANSAFINGNITASNLNIPNWNTAFGWGNHAVVGYITASVFSVSTSSWDTAYNKMIVSASFAGVNVKTLSLFYQDGTSITASFTDLTGSSISNYNISGTNNYLLRFSGSNAIVKSVVYDDGINVGINIIPSYSLDISGSLATRGAIFKKGLSVYITDADYIVKDTDSEILLNSIIGSNRNIIFSTASQVSFENRELTIINTYTGSFNWMLNSNISHSFAKPNGQQITYLPSGSTVLYCYQKTVSNVYQWIITSHTIGSPF